MIKNKTLSGNKRTTTSPQKPLKKLTLREFKQHITALMENYSTENPVYVSITHQEETQHFNIIPRHMRINPRDIVFDVMTISIEELETVTEPGLYKSSETYHMENKEITNFYGLFIDPNKKRDLRYFSSNEKCEEWLKKKVKALNVY